MRGWVRGCKASEQASKRAGRAACAAWVLFIILPGEQETVSSGVGFGSELAGLGLNSLDLDLYVCMYVRRVRGVE